MPTSCPSFNNLSCSTSERLHRPAVSTSTSMSMTMSEDEDEDETRLYTAERLAVLEMANSADYYQQQQSLPDTTAGFDGCSWIPPHDDKCSSSPRTCCHDRLSPSDGCDFSHFCTKDAASVQQSQWTEVSSGQHSSTAVFTACSFCQANSSPSSPLSSPCQRHHSHHRTHHHHPHQPSSVQEDKLSSALYLPVTTTTTPPRQRSNRTLPSSPSHSIAHYHSLMPTSTLSPSSTTLLYHSLPSCHLSSSSLSPFYRTLLCLVTLLALILSDHRVASDRNRFCEYS